MVNVKEHVKGNQKARFDFYRGSILYYKTEKGLLFEIPVSETGDAVFGAEERAMLLMRWIRKQLEENEKGRKECVQEFLHK